MEIKRERYLSQLIQFKWEGMVLPLNFQFSIFNCQLTSRRLGEPDRSVVKKGQQFLTKSLYFQEFNEDRLKKRCICAASFQYNIDKKQ